MARKRKARVLVAPPKPVISLPAPTTEEINAKNYTSVIPPELIKKIVKIKPAKFYDNIVVNCLPDGLFTADVPVLGLLNVSIAPRYLDYILYACRWIKEDVDHAFDYSIRRGMFFAVEGEITSYLGECRATGNIDFEAGRSAGRFVPSIIDFDSIVSVAAGNSPEVIQSVKTIAPARMPQAAMVQLLGA